MFYDDMEWLSADVEPRSHLNSKTRTQTASNLKVAKMQIDQMKKPDSVAANSHVSLLFKRVLVLSFSDTTPTASIIVSRKALEVS